MTAVSASTVASSVANRCSKARISSPYSYVDSFSLERYRLRLHVLGEMVLRPYFLGVS